VSKEHGLALTSAMPCKSSLPPSSLLVPDWKEKFSRMGTISRISLEDVLEIKEKSGEVVKVAKDFVLWWFE